MRASNGWLVAIALCAACSSNERPARPDADAGAGGTGGAAGAGATGGEGGGSGIGGSAGSGPCHEVLVTGTVDGQAVDGVLGMNRGGSSFATQDWQNLRWVTGGGIVAFGTGGASSGGPVSGKALLSAPTDYDLQGRQLFADTFTATYGDGSKPAMLDNLRDLGTCPGTSAAGTLTLCKQGIGGSTCTNDFTIAGSLDGTPMDFATSNAPLAYVNSEGEDRLGGPYGGDGYIVLEGLPGQLRGVLVLPTSHSEAGKVICVGASTRTEVGDDSQYELRDLSFSGASLPGAQVSGSLEIVNCK